MNRIHRSIAASLGVMALTVLVPPTQGAAQGQHGTPATITLDNTRGVPVVVYLEQGDFDLRLGMVAAHETQKLALPKYLDDDQVVQVFVHPEGGVDLASQDVTVKRGENIKVYVPESDNGYVPPAPPETIPNPGQGTTTVTVKNPRAKMVTVFVEQGAFDTRIGTVPADQERTLEIPTRLTEGREGVEIFIHPEGGVDLSSHYMDLHKGAHLLIQVPLNN